MSIIHILFTEFKKQGESNAKRDYHARNLYFC
jgi:hypothetical protein